MTPWHRRQREARQLLGSAGALLAAAAKPPSVMAATVLRNHLHYFARRACADGDAAALAFSAAAGADAYIRDMGRESWRRPGPEAYGSVAEKARQAALTATTQAAATLAEPPPPEPSDEKAPEVAAKPPNGAAFPQVDDDWYDNPYLWRDCYRGSMSMSHTDVPAATLVRAVEKHLHAADLADSHVVVEDDFVVAYWAPDEHEDWERDLLLGALEDAAQAVGLPPSRARVRWRRSHH